MDPDAHSVARLPGAQSRWTGDKDLSWEPLRVERVCEVKDDHLQGDRFRHATHFLRWRPDKAPGDCRYDQLETTPPFELRQVFQGGGPSALVECRTTNNRAIRASPIAVERVDGQSAL